LQRQKNVILLDTGPGHARSTGTCHHLTACSARARATSNPLSRPRPLKCPSWHGRHDCRRKHAQRPWRARARTIARRTLRTGLQQRPNLAGGTENAHARHRTGRPACMRGLSPSGRHRPAGGEGETHSPPLQLRSRVWKRRRLGPPSVRGWVGGLKVKEATCWAGHNGHSTRVGCGGSVPVGGGVLVDVLVDHGPDPLLPRRGVSCHLACTAHTFTMPPAHATCAHQHGSWRLTCWSHMHMAMYLYCGGSP
jgi:hypothetical protein